MWRTARLRGHERAEDWRETLSELLLSFVNGAPTYVSIDANGGLGSPTSKQIGSLSAEVASFPCEGGEHGVL